LLRGLGMSQQAIDILSHSVIIPSELLALQSPCSGGRHGKEILKPHFLKERWGFLFNDFFLKFSIDRFSKKL
jgi:hypothetical protein